MRTHISFEGPKPRRLKPGKWQKLTEHPTLSLCFSSVNDGRHPGMVQLHLHSQHLVYPISFKPQSGCDGDYNPYSLRKVCDSES